MIATLAEAHEYRYDGCRIKHMLGAANELILWDLKAKAVKSGRIF